MKHGQPCECSFARIVRIGTFTFLIRPLLNDGYYKKNILYPVMTWMAHYLLAFTKEILQLTRIMNPFACQLVHSALSAVVILSASVDENQ